MNPGAKARFCVDFVILAESLKEIYNALGHILPVLRLP